PRPADDRDVLRSGAAARGRTPCPRGVSVGRGPRVRVDAGLTLTMQDDFSVIAVIATYNEEDVIDACLRHLRDQGVSAYLIDDGSTDDTVRIAEAHLGRGLI